MDIQKLLAMKTFSVDQTYVSMKLAKEVITTEAKDKNLVFSLLSIHVLLGIIVAGSSGQPLQELLDYLNADSGDELNSWLSQLVEVLFADGSSLGGPRLSCANIIWVAEGFQLKPGFKKFVENTYKAVLDKVDFRSKVKVQEAATKVNQRVEAETNGLIKQVISSASTDPLLTRLVLGNAVYFKGAWVRLFNQYSTKHDSFFLLNGSSVQAPFMTMIGLKQYVSAFVGFKVLGLPYRKGSDTRSFSMYIFLPDATDGLHDLVDKVNSEPGFIEHHLPHHAVHLKKFCVPKFKICSEFKAAEVLKNLGIGSIFRDELITEMVDENLNVQHVLHKAFIEVNERGTEAAGLTNALCGGGSIDYYKDCLEFVADHPFLFIIREDATGMVLFLGQVVNPLAE